MTVWRMRIAYCTPKATNTHSQYVMLITFPLHQWLQPSQCYIIHTLPVLLGTFQVLMAMIMASFGIRRHVCARVCVKVRRCVLFNKAVSSETCLNLVWIRKTN